MHVLQHLQQDYVLIKDGSPANVCI